MNSSMLCPVCHCDMDGSYGLSEIFLCKQFCTTYLAEYNCTYSYYHCSMMFIEGKPAYQLYEFPPFKITINGNKSDICKIQNIYEDTMDLHIVFEKLFTVPSAIVLPWHDPQTCIKKIKDLIIFS